MDVYDLYKLSFDFGVEGVGGFSAFVLFVAVVDVLAQGIQFLPDFVCFLGVVLARHL
jgi:hypothetical protein